jgi:hypothetical protein
MSGATLDPNALAAGQRLRLKKELYTIDLDNGEKKLLDETKLAPITQMFLEALRTYGAIPVDSGSATIGFYAESVYTANLDMDDVKFKKLLGNKDTEGANKKRGYYYNEDGKLEPCMNQWHTLMEQINTDLETIPVVWGKCAYNISKGKTCCDPANDCMEFTNFEVVEPAVPPYANMRPRPCPQSLPCPPHRYQNDKQYKRKSHCSWSRSGECVQPCVDLCQKKDECYGNYECWETCRQPPRE